MKSLPILFLFWVFFSGCCGNYLYVQQETVGVGFLASSVVGTPDPRQEDPPEGQRLLVGWDFPRSVFQKQIHLLISVRLWDYSLKEIVLPLERKRDAAAFFFPACGSPSGSENGPQNGKGRAIMTYRVQAVDREGNQVAVWDHQLWTEWIGIDRSAAAASSDSVSSQPKQGSVTETP